MKHFDLIENMEGINKENENFKENENNNEEKNKENNNYYENKDFDEFKIISMI
jgi:hypothetical protein